MAVVQLRNGIYINSTEEVPAAEQTAAYKYASIFTKARKENWEMSQRQAASEIADAKVRDAAAIKSYDAQIAAYNDRLKKLDEDIALTGRDVAKANAATQRTALQEATAQQQTAVEWAKARAEGVVVPGASRSRSESESKGSGGGGGTSVRALDKAGNDAGDVIRLKMSGAPDATANQIGAVQNGLVEGSRTLDMSTPDKVMGVHATVIGDLIGRRKAKKINAGMSEEDAANTAETEVLAETAASPYKQYGLDYEAAQKVRAQEAATGGRTSKTESSSSRDASTVQPRYQGLGDMPVADKVTAENTPQVPLDTAELKAARDKLAEELAALLDKGAPASEVDDFITRSREIMAGRFGRVAESPNFYQRNVAQAILTGRMTNEDIADLKSKYANEKLNRAINRPGADPNAAGSATPVSPDSSGATPTTEPIVPDGSTPAVSPDASGASSDGLTSPEPGPTSSGITVTEGGSGGGPGPQPFARLITRRPGVPDYFGEEGLSTMDVENLRLAQRQGLPPEILDAMNRLEKPAQSTTVDGQRMQAPAGAADTFSMPARNSVYFPTTATAIGRKPEAAGDFSVPDMPPETPAPGNPDYVPTPAYMPPRQPGLNVTWEQKGYVEPSEEEKQQILDIKQKQREKREGQTGSTLEYFKSRFDNAKQIVDQPGKLARLVASGPGKVAADVYNANKTTGKDFKLTYDTLTATYEDDKEALAVAHQVALALDIAARARTAPPKA
jgi:hypothetical protein